MAQKGMSSKKTKQKREEREAEALRANLRKRKEWHRGRKCDVVEGGKTGFPLSAFAKASADTS
jgi:hypothetical protein